jgi:hypothetical protein
VLWETLTLRPLVLHDNPGAVAMQVLEGRFEPPSRHRPELSHVLDSMVMRGLSANRDERCSTALEMAEMLEQFEMASAGELGRWVREACAERLVQRAELVSAIDRAIESLPAAPSAPNVSEVRGVLRQADAKARSEQPTINFEEGVSEVTSAVLPSKQPPKKSAITSVLLVGLAICALAAMGYGGFAFTRPPKTTAQRMPSPLQVDLESAADDDGVSTRAPAPSVSSKPTPVPGAGPAPRVHRSPATRRMSSTPAASSDSVQNAWASRHRSQSGRVRARGLRHASGPDMLRCLCPSESSALHLLRRCCSRRRGLRSRWMSRLVYRNTSRRRWPGATASC